MKNLLLLLATSAMLLAPVHADPAFPVRIALVTDTHTSRGTTGEDPLFKGRYDRTIAAVNAAHVALVLIAGDLVNGPSPGQIADFKAQTAGFVAPTYWVPGNHDVGNKKLTGKPGEVSAASVAAYEAALGPSYWVVEKAGLRFIGIDASVLGSGLQSEADQWAFLDKQMTQLSPKPTLLMLHYPPFLTSADEPGGAYWNIEPEPRARLLALLKSGGVCAVLTGHLHRALRNTWNGIPIITSVPVSFGSPKGWQSVGWTLITVSKDGKVDAETQSIGPD